MIAKRIRGATVSLDLPSSFDPRPDAVAVRLHVRVTPSRALHGLWCTETAWEPTPAELARLNAGGTVTVKLLSNCQMPMAVGVAPPAEDDALAGSSANGVRARDVARAVLKGVYEGLVEMVADALFVARVYGPEHLATLGFIAQGWGR